MSNPEAGSIFETPGGTQRFGRATSPSTPSKESSPVQHITEATKIKLTTGTWGLIVSLLVIHTVGITTYFERRFSGIEKDAAIVANKMNGYDSDISSVKAAMGRDRAEVIDAIGRLGTTLNARFERAENKLDRVAEEVARQGGSGRP